jgi:hypothetical protein
VAANLGKVLLESGWMSAIDQEIQDAAMDEGVQFSKAILLCTVWGLTAAKAIPRPGEKPNRHNAASQLKLGAMWGLDRSTMNRYLRKFCGEDATVIQFFNKAKGGVGCVNRYTEKDPPPKPSDKERLKQHDPERLAAKFGKRFFDPNPTYKLGAIEIDERLHGSGEVFLFTYSETLPKTVRCTCRKGQMKFNFKGCGDTTKGAYRCLKCGGKGYTIPDLNEKMGPSARLVLTVLQLKGIAKWGFLEMSNTRIGKLCGLSENTVATALDEWENLKVLQIVPGKIHYEDFLDPKTGRPAVKFREPQRIIWLPGQLLDHDVAENERRRFQEAAETVFLTFGLTPSLQIARQRHAELLEMWQLSRHSVGSLWSYLRKYLITREACDRGQIDMLFPLHKAWDDG